MEQPDELAELQLELSEVLEAKATEVVLGGVSSFWPYALGHHGHNRRQSVATAVDVDTVPSVIPASTSGIATIESLAAV